MLETAKEVSEMFAQKISVYDAGFAKPIDENLIAQLEKYKYVFTIEDGVRRGGFGEHLRTVLQKPICHALGFPDIFPETGTRKELFARYNLDAKSIYKTIKEGTARPE
jgi:1-deoxy-D-xylulose-5-phosphate synthase